MLHSAFILLNSNKACAPPQRFWGSGPQPGRAGVRLQAIGGALAVQQFFYVCQSLFGGLEMDCFHAKRVGSLDVFDEIIHKD